MSKTFAHIKVSTNNSNKIKRRSQQQLNKSELSVLHFLWMKEHTNEKDYWTYSSDPQLQNFTQKSQQQLQRSLRNLERKWNVLISTSPENLRGTPVFYHVPYPKFRLVKHLIGKLQGDMLGLYMHYFIEHTENPMFSYVLAGVFNVRKRTAQKRIKKLVDEGLLHRTKKLKHCRNGKLRKYPAYGIGKGQKPITHWIEKKEN